MVLGSDASRDYVEVVVGQLQSRMGPIIFPHPPGRFSWECASVHAAPPLPIGLHDACDVSKGRLTAAPCLDQHRTAEQLRARLAFQESPEPS